jgi:transglutaminase/protease-like cytokinesis protein 3
MGERRKFRKVSVDYVGARQYAWIDRNGEIVREEGMLGISMEKSSKQQATEGISTASADLTEMASLPSNINIPDPGTLKTISVKLGNADAKTFFLDGDRQQFKDGVLTVTREVLPETRVQTMKIPGDISEYLRATPFIQSEDAMIKAKAREISSYDDARRLRAMKIVTWVYNNIEKRPVLSVPNALETLINHVGDCNEHAVLVAALARASGIPAQIEAGLVYQRGKFYYHAWNVLYVGGKWVTADAVLNQIPADVTHIRFVRGEADRQLDLVGLIGQVKMEVLSAR